MAESDLRGHIVKAMASRDAQAIETHIRKGVPDVHFIEGWIELKWLRAWPKKPDTIVSLDHPVTKEQRVWLKRRWMRGGNCWLILQCRNEYFAFDGLVASNRVGRVTQQELRKIAYRTWTTKPTGEELIQCLRRND